MKALILFLLAAVSIQARAEVPHDGNFKVISTPKVWSTGSKICFSQNKQPQECATVTGMGEIVLRNESNTAADIAEFYLSRLSKEDQAVITSYKKFVVRYLALDGGNEGRYIVQLFINVGPGTQAVYIYGNYRLQADTLSLSPVGYGEAGFNLSMLRTIKDDQDAIRAANHVIDLWSGKNAATLQSKN
jgi:hypothetical protein